MSAPAAEALAREQAVTTLIEARRRVTDSIPTRHRMRWVLDDGWTPARYEWLDRLLTGARVARLAVAGWPGAEWLVTSAEDAVRAGADWDSLIPWLRLMAGAPDARSAEQLGDMLGYWDRMETWWLGVPEDLRRLAHAAGLTPEETRRRATDGTLDALRLRTLAALRGWRLP